MNTTDLRRSIFAAYLLVTSMMVAYFQSSGGLPSLFHVVMFAIVLGVFGCSLTYLLVKGRRYRLKKVSESTGGPETQMFSMRSIAISLGLALASWVVLIVLLVRIRR